jgi:hypothetical protein
VARLLLLAVLHAGRMDHIHLVSLLDGLAAALGQRRATFRPATRGMLRALRRRALAALAPLRPADADASNWLTLLEASGKLRLPLEAAEQAAVEAAMCPRVPAMPSALLRRLLSAYVWLGLHPGPELARAVAPSICFAGGQEGRQQARRRRRCRRRYCPATQMKHCALAWQMQWQLPVPPHPPAPLPACRLPLMGGTDAALSPPLAPTRCRAAAAAAAASPRCTPRC